MYRLAKDEVELVGPVVGREAFELLRAYHVREWHDRDGRWHVVIAASRVAEIEEVERDSRLRRAEERHGA